MLFTKFSLLSTSLGIVLISSRDAVHAYNATKDNGFEKNCRPAANKPKCEKKCEKFTARETEGSSYDRHEMSLRRAKSTTFPTGLSTPLSGGFDKIPPNRPAHGNVRDQYLTVLSR